MSQNTRFIFSYAEIFLIQECSQGLWARREITRCFQFRTSLLWYRRDRRPLVPQRCPLAPHWPHQPPVPGHSPVPKDRECAIAGHIEAVTRLSGGGAGCPVGGVAVR